MTRFVTPALADVRELHAETIVPSRSSTPQPTASPQSRPVQLDLFTVAPPADVPSETLAAETTAQPARVPDAAAHGLTPAARCGVKDWLTGAATEWRQHHGLEMTVRWSRDLALLKPLLRLHGPDELSARWQAYIATEDPFLARRGWDVPTFSTCVDRFAGSTDRAEVIGIRNLRPIRDSNSGAVIGTRRGW